MTQVFQHQCVAFRETDTLHWMQKIDALHPAFPVSGPASRISFLSAIHLPGDLD